ncbi:MAG: nidogen-like domain-containing protein [Coriobacteriia bacterium]|nr:nidogen-like domain-containing protein [Coriobacteriia bacterium]
MPLVERQERTRFTPGPGWRALSLASLVCLLALVAPTLAFAEGPNAIMKPAGYDAMPIARGDDNSVQTVVLPFSMNWFGTTYNRIYINQNGNVTFTGGLGTYTPTNPLNNAGRDIIAPFFADVDTGTTATPNASQTTYSDPANPPKVGGRNAVFVNWIDVGYYNHQDVPLNSFQLVLVDRSDTGAGNFDMYFNYDKVLWDRGSASGNRRARVGWGRQGGTFYEFAGSGATSGNALLDSGAASTSLIQNYLNPEGQLGRYLWQVRAGVSPNAPPKLVVADRLLEGNALNGYVGYTGSSDATGTDPEGGAVTTTRAPSLPTTLPLGTSTFLWTSTDRGNPVPTAANVAVTTETQTIQVRDTTPPTRPVVTSSTHATGTVWSAVPTVTVSWTASTDVCTQLDGYSYSWSQNTTAAPDAVIDPATSTVRAVPGEGVWYFNITAVDHAGNRSQPVSLGPIRIDTVAPSTTDDAPPGWSSVNVTVTLTATDPSGVVTGIRYRVDGSLTATYSAPLVVSVEGTHTLEYWAVDAAGNVEALHSRLVRVDKSAPTVPSPVYAASPDTRSVEVSWTPSLDSVSGIGYYALYVDGSLESTTTGRTRTVTGLTSGQAYSFVVRAYDRAGNRSAATPAVTETVPFSMLWLNVSNTSVDFGGLFPAVPNTIPGATVVTVGGLGPMAYDLSCAGADFANTATSSATPTMPVGQLTFVTSGWSTAPSRAFSASTLIIDTSTGVPFTWKHDYIFDYTMTLPWTSEPGTYTTSIMYTAVAQ